MTANTSVMWSILLGCCSVIWKRYIAKPSHSTQVQDLKGPDISDLKSSHQDLPLRFLSSYTPISTKFRMQPLTHRPFETVKFHSIIISMKRMLLGEVFMKVNKFSSIIWNLLGITFLKSLRSQNSPSYYNNATKGSKDGKYLNKRYSFFNRNGKEKKMDKREMRKWDSNLLRYD